MRDRITDVYDWLGEELRDILPSRDGGEYKPAGVTLQLGRQGIVIEFPVSGKDDKSILVSDVSELANVLRDLCSRSKPTKPDVAIIVSPERYLKRQISPLRLPKSRLEAMAKLDVQASTPFAINDVHLVCTGHDGKSDGSGYLIVKKAFFDPVLAAVSEAGLAVREIRFSGDAASGGPATYAESALVPPSLWKKLRRRMPAVAAALITTAVALTMGHAYWRYRQAGNELDQQISVARTEALAVRKLIAERNRKIDQISEVRKQKQSSVPVAVILEEMSRVIPDSAWLSDIQIGGDTISFTGMAASAASLIPALDQSPLFKAPTFKAPVVRVSNQDGERFTITMEVEASDG